MSPEDFVVLNDEIRAFVRAGIPLDIGLQGTAGRTVGALSELSGRLAHRLRTGASIEDALAAEGERLPATYRAVLAAGLRTGRLDEVLASVSELAESTTTLRRRTQLALIYPTAVLVLATALFGFFTTNIIPQMQRTYVLFGFEPSTWMRGLIWLQRPSGIPGVSTALVLETAIVVGGMVVLGIVGYASAGPYGIPRWLPGGRDLSLARFARVLSLLVRHDVPLPAACRLSGQAAGDARIAGASRHLAEAVEGGQSLPEAMDRARELPSFLRWLIVVGERQGSLPASLRQAADVYEQRALNKLEWFHRIVPPVTVAICCGTITLLYGLSLFVPLAEMLRRLGAA